MPTVHEGQLDGNGLRVAVVAARFNEFVTRPLHDGALRALTARGVADGDIHVVWVPGAIEIPGAAARAIDSLEVDAVIAIGAVIRGETAHFDYVCRYATDGVREVALSRGVPVMFCVLTVDTAEQALERAGDGPDNRGFEAALGAIEMARLYAEMGNSR